MSEDELQPPDTGDLVIGVSPDRILVTITPKGEIIYGPDYTPDEAALAFWEAMAQQRLKTQDRLLLVDHMEAMLTRLGEQDLRTEDLRFRAAAEEEKEPGGNTARALRAAAENGMAALSLICGECIELGRGLVHRNLPKVEVPVEVPQSVQDNPRSNYQGLEGLPKDEEPEITFSAPAPPRGKAN